MNPTEYDLELLNDLAALGEGAPPINPDHWEMMPATQETYEDKLVQAKRTLGQFKVEAEALKGAVFSILIKDTSGQSQVAELKATAQSVIKKIDARVKELTKEPEIIKQWNAYCLAVKNFAANIEVPLKEAKGEADRKYAIFSEYERQERRKQEQAAIEATRKLQAQIDKQAEKKGIEPVVLPLPTAGPAKVITRTDSGTTYTKTTWEFTVFAPTLVDRKYCSPDLKKLREAVDGGARENEIDGVTIFEKSTPITRTR